ncbi:sensor histidine kinase [Rhizobium phaseoli]|uniref:sensor histidine kinase n=1 Tax=Rhizobium phaseoli TaxID=396 RepID=UPI001FED2C13|nr:HAMP domain-containing sensor histidine kinase [Rhizobium phaseoli]
MVDLPAGCPSWRPGIRRSASLVNKLLRLARYDAREPAPAPRPIDLAQHAVDTIARLTPLAGSRSIDLGITRRDKAVTNGALADLEIILDNLVENAVLYTPPSGTVDVAVMVAGQEARIEIRDTGPGIAEEELPRVFERSFRAMPQDGEGSGLGLAIAKAAAERQEVRLTLAMREDEPGLIACLVVRLAPNEGVALVPLTREIANGMITIIE